MHDKSPVNTITFDTVQVHSKFITRHFYKREWLLFILLAIVGLLSSTFTFHTVKNWPFNSGRPLAGLFVPVTTTIFYLVLFCRYYDIKKMNFRKCLILYVLQILPYAPLFFQEIAAVPYDDYSRYLQYATNMYNQHTLWGSDQLIYKDAGLHYITQPGYRYFLLLQLVLFGKIYRLISFVQAIMYLYAAWLLCRTIMLQVKNTRLKMLLLLLVLLFTPYAMKNSLMGLQEWLTFFLLATGVYNAVVAKRPGLAILMLGFVPFLRQNLLISVALMSVFIIAHSRRKALLTVFFVLLVLLPVYHNLYYAGSWRFFVDMHRIPFVAYQDERGTIPVGIDYRLLANNLLHYLGIDMEGGKMDFFPIAAFLPFALVLYYRLCISFADRKMQLRYLLITLSAIVPSVLLGAGYYPRFEFVNVVVAIVAYLLLMGKELERSATPAAISRCG